MSIFDAVYELAKAEQGSGSKKEVWYRVCVCGHQEHFHGQGIGGTYGTDPGYEGNTVDGCRGATPKVNDPAPVFNPMDGSTTALATCPCRKFREVAMVDRPRRAMRQKITKDGVHPMIRGLKAMRSELISRNEKYGTVRDPAAELERRFYWLPGAQKCDECGVESEDVTAAYVPGTRDSEMRCSRHR